MARRKRETRRLQATGVSATQLATVIGTVAANLRAHYEVLNNDHLRKQPNIRTDRTVTEQMFYGIQRLKAYWLADTLYDNDAIGATVDTCIRLAIGATGGKPQFIDDDTTQAAWDTWAKSAGWAEGENWNELLQIILRAVKLHGDCLIVADPDITDGRLRIWDADQIVLMQAADFDKWCNDNSGFDDIGDEREQWRQVEGAVLDTGGRVRGWFVSCLRNRYSCASKDITFIPVTLGRRIGYRRKISQYRGEPQIIPNADLSNDTRDLLKSEVQAAKNTAEMSLIVERAGQADNLSAMLSGLDASSLTEGTGITENDLKLALGSTSNDFQALAGKSAIAQVEAGTKIHELNNAARPSAMIQTWVDNLADANGKRLGVMSCLSRGRADNSYSSGQIELSISWTTFEEDQKLLERQVVDYVVGQLFPGKKYMVTWPRQFEIDPHKAESTLDARLRGGRTTYRETLGPNWRAKLAQLAEEKRYLQEQGLDNLSFFQTAAGARASDTESTPTETKEHEQ